MNGTPEIAPPEPGATLAAGDEGGGRGEIYSMDRLEVHAAKRILDRTGALSVDEHRA